MSFSRLRSAQAKRRWELASGAALALCLALIASWSVYRWRLNEELRRALSERSVKRIAALVRHGADVNLRGKKGVTPLMHAAWHGGGRKLIEEFLDRGATPTARDTDGQTAATYAAMVSDVDSTRVLLDRGAPSDRDLLYYAALDDSPKMARFLLDRGFDAGGKSADGIPLYFAAGVGALPTMRLLIARGAPVDLGYRNETPLANAARNLNTDAVRFLLSRGADPERRTVDGTALLQWAAEWNDAEMAGLLRSAIRRRRAAATHRREARQ